MSAVSHSCDTHQDWDEGTDVSKQNDQKLTEMEWSEWKIPFSPLFGPGCCGLGFFLKATDVLK